MEEKLGEYTQEKLRANIKQNSNSQKNYKLRKKKQEKFKHGKKENTQEQGEKTKKM